MSSDAASLRQVRASDPQSSTWLSANAGSGKTRVLTDRVARLLLLDVEPQRILCLTYTKSAASEMQNRLFRTLGEWAMKPDAALRAALAALGEERMDADHLARARRLFARAIETPGGLRIQTIHSFCATLLRRFPLEAGVSPRFGELDERSARLLRQDILEDMAAGLAPDAVSQAALEFSGSDFMDLVEEIVAKRDSFRSHRLESGEEPEAEATILADVFLGGEADWMRQVLAVLAGGLSTDVKAAAQLADLKLDEPDLQTLEGLEEVLLFKSGKTAFAAKIGSFPTKDTRGLLGDLLPRLESLMRRVEAARPRRIARAAARKTAALWAFAAAFLPIYEDRKVARGWLDFDDLIARATTLVTNPSVAAWVLYRLDGGIDHVLVDEAQDTSPAQWRVIELLTAEFTAGESARDVARTVFVVGDQKQSIYSFQGADVAAFDDKQRAFGERFGAAGQAFQSLKLEHSFRSAPAILGFVDAALKDRDAAALGVEVAHLAYRDSLPGRVDLWTPIEVAKDPVDKNFDDPVDLITSAHHVAQLAEKVADWIADMLTACVTIVARDGVRAVHAGDFLILVQSRSTLFTEIIRACKKRGLPIAGADRLNLGAELAVKDLLALLAFLDTPDDDLSLAAVLRSPICGLSEAELYDLAQGRSGSLWDALASQAARFQAAFDLLADLRGQVDFLRPYDLLERTLVRHDARRRLIARLSDEAEDAIDELLNQALAYERAEAPSLTGFLIWLDAEEIDVKRQADVAGRRIRVMTVHGAKGLESEIVILPDTADHRPQDRAEIYIGPDGEPMWKLPDAESPPVMTALRQQRSIKGAEERLRLLYVAMTRARTWLVIAAAGSVKSPSSWHAIAQDGMTRVGGTPTALGMRYETGIWPEGPTETAAPASTVATLPSWATSAPLLRPATPALLTPSNLGGAKALPGEASRIGEVAATDRGTAIHLLLQHLPNHPHAAWPTLARHLVADPHLSQDALTEARSVLAQPDFAEIFATDALVEVGVTAAVEVAGASRRLYGVIDRLILGTDSVLAVDFKSNSLVPTRPEDVPEGLLRQLGAYHAILSQLYPAKSVQTAILWTRPALLMPVNADIVRAALQRSTMDSGADP